MNPITKRCTSGFVLLMALALYCQAGLSQQPPPNRPLVLKGATAIDGLGKAPIRDAVIVIEGERIKSFGGKGTPYPADATVVDVSGKFVIPGLVDSHTHFRPWLGELFLNYGVTTIMVPSNPDYTVEQRDASQSGEARTPRIFRSPRLALVPGMTEEQVRSLVQDWLKKKPDYANLPVYNDRNKQAYQWAVQQIHDAGLVVFGHTENAPESVGIGQDVVEHLWGFAQALMTPRELEDYQKGEYLHWGSFLKDEARIDRMIQEAVGRGVYLNPTMVYELGSQSSLTPKHELDAYNSFRDPALMTYFPENLADGALLKFRSVRTFSTKYENQVALSRLSPKDLQEFKEAYRLCGEFIRKWVRAGGKIIGGTDDPSSGIVGLTLHMEMAMLVEVGLTPMQALQAATSWGAEMLTARRTGSTRPPIGLIAEGAYADLVVLGANPLENIDNTKKIERVMKGGKFIQLGYTPYYATTKAGELSTIPSIQAPEISSITPHVAVEGSPELEMVVDGVGFAGNSVVRVDGVAVPTTFVNIRTLQAKIPAGAVSRALPNRFNQPGPEQRVGVYGDRTVKITVFNGPPDGGESNSVSLRVIAKWLAEKKD